jgi:twitching motility protein PilT
MNMDKERFNQLLTAIILDGTGISDLLFIPGRPPQMDRYGQLHAYKGRLAEPLVSSQFTEQLAGLLIEGNERLGKELLSNGSCDCSYDLPGAARFRVNVYRQNGQMAVVMRKLSNTVPEVGQLGLPPVITEIVKERTGIIFVTGATGMGKTTTIASILHELNKTRDIHVITLEDPIEFLHTTIRATFSQREFGRDFFSYAVGLRAALRQAPRAIFVGEIRDRDTMEVALSAAETGHLVLTTLHTINAGQTINRILGMFDKDEEQIMRQRLADTLRWVLCQQLVSRIGGGLHLVTEVMGSNLRSREVITLGEAERRNVHEIIEGSVSPWGWHSFEQSLLKAYVAGIITEENAMLHSTHKSKLGRAIDAAGPRRMQPQSA